MSPEVQNKGTRAQQKGLMPTETFLKEDLVSFTTSVSIHEE